MCFYKKIWFIILLMLVSVFTLVGCDDEEKEEYFNLSEVLLESAKSGKGDIGGPISIVEMHYFKKMYDFNIYECEKKEGRALVAAYLEESTMEYLKNIYVGYRPHDYRFLIKGINTCIRKYQLGVAKRMIDMELYPVKCKYVTEEEISLIDGDKHLMFVFEEVYFSAKNIVTSEVEEFKVYDEVDGYIEGESFIINKEWMSDYSEFNYFLFDDDILEEYYSKRGLDYGSVKIYDRKYIDVAKTSLMCYDSSEEFLRETEEIKIMEYTINTDYVIYRYDYEKMLSFLREA